MIAKLPIIRKHAELVGSAKDDLSAFPRPVKVAIGYAIHLAQIGEKHPGAKPLKGFGGAGVLEVVDDYDGDAYRAVYTVKFAGAVYLLHAFQKKSKRGKATPPSEIDLIRLRLKLAQRHYKEAYLAAKTR